MPGFTARWQVRKCFLDTEYTERGYSKNYRALSSVPNRQNLQSEAKLSFMSIRGSRLVTGPVQGARVHDEVAGSKMFFRYRIYRERLFKKLSGA